MDLIQEGYVPIIGYYESQVVINGSKITHKICKNGSHALLVMPEHGGSLGCGWRDPYSTIELRDHQTNIRYIASYYDSKWIVEAQEMPTKRII